MVVCRHCALLYDCISPLYCLEPVHVFFVFRCSNYSLCEVTVENEDFVKTKRLPEQLANLPDRMTLNARYYVKNNMTTEALVPDDIVPDLIKVRVLACDVTSVPPVTTMRSLVILCKPQAKRDLGHAFVTCM